MEMAQRGKAALPGLVVLLLVSQYLVVYFLSHSCWSLLMRGKFISFHVKAQQWLWERNLKVCPTFFLLTGQEKKSYEKILRTFWSYFCDQT